MDSNYCTKKECPGKKFFPWGEGQGKDAVLHIEHPDYLFPVASWEICKFGIIEETPYSS